MNTSIPNTMIHQQSSQNTIMEVKEDFMTSLVSHTHPTFRTAHFLKPIAHSIQQPPSSSTCSVFQSKEGFSKIHFNVWRYPHNKWVRWVDQLKPKYESVWEKAGIFEPIMSTKSRIMKNHDLVCGVAEKWCSETNTFVFPFGEATITLEDVIVLGGYSAFGDPIFTSIEDKKMKEVEKKLMITDRKIRVIKSLPPTTSKWMDFYIGSGSEIEHEAFLATWLSVFVFPHKLYVIRSCLFPIAIRLARGNHIALAPAVLACLYKDLSLLREKIVDSRKSPFVIEVNIQSPFYLVQVWVWERFKNLQPQPNLIDDGDPLLLKWHKVNQLKMKTDKVRLALDSAINDFIWRPYVQYADNCGLFYPNDEILLPLRKDSDRKTLSFVISLRVSELVGFECIEQYLPHRVAMQFGIDQDVPCFVPRFNKTQTMAWKNYCRPLSDTSLYFPSRFSEANVTTRYEKWWKTSVSLSKCRDPKVVGAVPRLLITMPSEKSGSIPSVAPSSSLPKQNTLTPLISVVEDSNHILEDNIVDNVPSGSMLSVKDGLNVEEVLEDVDFEDNIVDNVPSDSMRSVKDGLNVEEVLEDVDFEDNIVDNVPSGSMLYDNSVEDGLNVEDCRQVVEDVEFNDDANENEEALLSKDEICQSETQTESYSYLSDVSMAELEQKISRLEKVRTVLKKKRLLK